MTERNRTRPKTTLWTNNSDCCPRCRLLAQNPEDEFHPASFDLPETGEVLWHYPLEPHWWRDPAAHERRDRVIDDFRFADLHLLIDFTTDAVHGPLNTADDVAVLVMTALSLSWLTDVATAWHQRYQSKESLECNLQHQCIKRAEIIAELALRYLMDVSPRLSGPGIRLAMARPFETVPSEE